MVVTAAEIFLVSFMAEDWREWIDEVRILSHVFAMVVEDERWVCMK
jgi:hypothetical protein